MASVINFGKMDVNRSLISNRHGVAGVELYDYRKVDMTDFDQFDRDNVAGQPAHAAAQKLLATVLHSHFNNM